MSSMENVCLIARTNDLLMSYLNMDLTTIETVHALYLARRNGVQLTCMFAVNKTKKKPLQMLEFSECFFNNVCAFLHSSRSCVHTCMNIAFESSGNILFKF